MQLTLPKKLIHHSFFLSAILHILLLCFFLSISTVITFHPIKELQKPPQLYIPSYVYKGTVTPPAHAQPTSSAAKTESSTPSAMIPSHLQNKAGTLASGTSTRVANPTKDSFFQKNILAMSRNMIQRNQVDTALNNMNNTEPPILLIGDKRAIVDPLVKLLGRSLSAHFHYPRIQGSFGVRGKVYVGMILHPEGYFSDVEIVQSSEIQDFNAAALYAVNTAPRVIGANKFLSQPKRFVVGFIFD